MLKIKDMNSNNVIRQGDSQPREYQLDTGNLNLNLTNKSATIRLMTADYQGIGYETTATVSSENKISFSIDDIIPAREYRLEITVDDYVFPSRATDGRFDIDPSSHGQEVNIIQIIGKDEIVREVKARVENELEPFLGEIEQAELDRQTAEGERAGAESTRETNEQTRLNKDLLRDDKIAQMEADKDAVIANATVDSEVILARGGKATLGQRLDETTAQLAQTESKLNTSTKTKRPLIVFISDDGKVEDYSVLAPIFEAKSVPCNFAVITSNTDVSSTAMTSAQLRDLKARGHGLLSHTHNHSDVTTLTEFQLHADFKATIEKLEAVTGERNHGLVYPYGSNNELAVKVAREYFDYAFATVNEGYFLNANYLDQYVIPRDVIAYEMGASPRTLENIKPLIDQCARDNSLLVYCIHASEFSYHPNNVTLLNDVLDYIDSVGIDVVTHDVAMAEKGNVIDIGTFKSDQYVKVSKSGSIYSNNLDKTLKNGNSFNSAAAVGATTPLTDFVEGEVTKNIIFFSNPEISDFPLERAGTLFTYYNLAGSDLNFQLYYPQNTTSFYRRDWNRWSLIWDPWKEFKPSSGDSSDSFDTVTRTIDSALTDFPVGITYSKIDSTNGSNFPEGYAGLLVTYHVWTGTDMNFQMWYPQGSSRVYKRNWNRWSSVWNPWVGILAGSSAKNITVTGRTLAAGASSYQDVTVTGAFSGDVVVATPRSVITAGLLIDTIVASGNTVRIRLFNATASSITIPDVVFDVAAIK